MKKRNPFPTCSKVYKTRFPELDYQRIGQDWRFISTDTDSRVGPEYPTRQALLDDIERYAEFYGLK